MHRLILLSLLALGLLPAAAHAAPAKLSPRASAVTAAGKVTIEAANPTRSTLRGTLTATVGGRAVATRSVRLPRRAVTELSLTFDAGALPALRAAAGRATFTLRVRRAGGRWTTARRRLTLRLPAAPPPSPAPVPGTPGGPAPAPAPASDRWVGRMGSEGAYDDLELTVAGGQLRITKPPLVPVSCFENGGSYRSALSLEPFVAAGPWTVGTDGSVAQSGISGNQLVSGGSRSITYKVTGTSQDAGRLAGTLGMSFFDSRYDVFTKTITFINCAGSQSFEAVPAG
jgi:hypothetical protein